MVYFGVEQLLEVGFAVGQFVLLFFDCEGAKTRVTTSVATNSAERVRCKLAQLLGVEHGSSRTPTRSRCTLVEVACHVYTERSIGLLQYGVGEGEGVEVAIVEGVTDKASTVMLDDASCSFVKADGIPSDLSIVFDRFFESCRGYFKARINRLFRDAMQHQNMSDDRMRQVMQFTSDAHGEGG